MEAKETHVRSANTGWQNSASDKKCDIPYWWC